MQYRSLSKGLLSVKDLSASRRKLEGYPSSRRDHRHTAMLPSRESSKKAHLGCHIYGIKWLACRQVTCHGKGLQETPSNQNFHCSLKNGSWKSHLLFMSYHMIGVPGSYVWMLTVPLCCGFQVETRRVLGLAIAQAFTSFGACTKPPPVWSRCGVHPS